MTRPIRPGARVNVSLSMPVELLRKLNYGATQVGVPPAELLRARLSEALEDVLVPADYPPALSTNAHTISNPTAAWIQFREAVHEHHHRTNRGAHQA